MSDRALIKKKMRIYTKYLSSEEEMNPERLFAVTNEISIEDTVRLDDGREVIYKGTILRGTKSQIKIDGEIIETNTYSYVKIIGEISPNTTWVKNNNKVEGRLEEYYYFPKSESWCQVKLSPAVLVSLEKPEKKEFFAVKCSQCETYH